ncbi:hypothetical protein [Streptomyces sp. NBC_01768]|uniref:hypothetical protein n=1 Tax=Streptomyces sp. NBC_01768 TaxID=2975938 RepID=UPI002DDA2A20|nr:hypothetical protein [Streptomyces sp. NBC_01768]WSC33991.1 hypothetical protein OG902_45265 [Streptomyces sp. NBC_01768]
MGQLVERVDEQDRVPAVVDRAEVIRQGWLHRVALVSHRSFVPDAREAFDQYRVLREANRPSSY